MIAFVVGRTGRIKVKRDNSGTAKTVTNSWTRLERNILLKYKKIHLLQQSHERQMLSQKILYAMKNGS